MRSIVCLVVFGVAVLRAEVLAGQTSNSPDSVLRAFHRATLEQRWLDAARFVDPTRVDVLRWDIIRSAARPERVRTVDDYLRDDPKMPREVAEYFVRNVEESMRRMGNGIPYQFADVEDTLTLRRLSQLEAAARYVQAKDPRYLFRLSYRITPGCEGRSVSETEAHELAPRFELLTTAVRGDTAWVMYRDTSRTGVYGFIGPGIATLFRIGDRWFVDIDQPQYGAGSVGMFAAQCTDVDSAATRRP